MYTIHTFYTFHTFHIFHTFRTICAFHTFHTFHTIHTIHTIRTIHTIHTIHTFLTFGIVASIPTNLIVTFFSQHRTLTVAYRRAKEAGKRSWRYCHHRHRRPVDWLRRPVRCVRVSIVCYGHGGGWARLVIT